MTGSSCGGGSDAEDSDADDRMIDSEIRDLPHDQRSFDEDISANISAGRARQATAGTGTLEHITGQRRYVAPRYSGRARSSTPVQSTPESCDQIAAKNEPRHSAPSRQQSTVTPPRLARCHGCRACTVRTHTPETGDTMPPGEDGRSEHRDCGGDEDDTLVLPEAANEPGHGEQEVTVEEFYKLAGYGTEEPGPGKPHGNTRGQAPSAAPIGNTNTRSENSCEDGLREKYFKAIRVISGMESHAAMMRLSARQWRASLREDAAAPAAWRAARGQHHQHCVDDVLLTPPQLNPGIGDLTAETFRLLSREVACIAGLIDVCNHIADRLVGISRRFEEVENRRQSKSLFSLACIAAVILSCLTFRLLFV